MFFLADLEAGQPKFQAGHVLGRGAFPPAAAAANYSIVHWQRMQHVQVLSEDFTSALLAVSAPHPYAFNFYVRLV